ncbi:putative amine oxidase [copper-containing] [Mizuhopecten yessoensis]|uniref:Amine oxidase n=1 Tax=Mizuhopecten yessoensis TaxID=6573 RepID=A0A210QKX7_MIZYE|nr:putative amine oxidase [copper-containing] [Mizuhopecten yessoensis]OWF49403.1 amine oxidase [copper-containing] [Mizuhopecten yessoensis]
MNRAFLEATIVGTPHTDVHCALCHTQQETAETMRNMETDLMMTSIQVNKPKFRRACKCVTRKDEEIPKSEKERMRVIVFQRLFGVSVVLNVAFLVTLAYLMVAVLRQDTYTMNSMCQQTKNYPSSVEIYDKSDLNKVFHDLTLGEIHNVIRYVYSHIETFNIRTSAYSNVSSSLIYSIERFIPSKDDIINYLSQSGNMPIREAQVVIFHGQRRVVNEYVIGPLKQNHSTTLMTSHRSKRVPARSLPFRLRQVTSSELWAIHTTIMEYASLHEVMKQSFGATLYNCIDASNTKRCANMYKLFVPVVYSKRRMLWVQFYYEMEFYTIHPIDFQLLIDVDIDSPKWTIKKVWYNLILYPSYEDFINSYKNGTAARIRQSFPETDRKSPRPYGSLRPQRVPSSKNTKRPPVQLELDGHRYKVTGQVVKYLKWSFHWVNSLKKGPTLFNVQFGKERVVYEMGLQDIVVIYTGDSPAMSRTAFADGFTGLGSKSAGLVPGVDCPGYATLLNVTITTEDFQTGGVLPNAICLFEHNLGRPLRRHYSTNVAEGGVFYGGLMATVLIFRTIYVINNYDYVLDYMFYENGAIEIKIYPTGYVLTAFQHPSERKYGFTVGENTTAPMHLHLFHFKIDIDILGKNNSYETLDIGVEQFDTPNLDGRGIDDSYRYKLTRQLKHTELEAAYKFNFSQPKYHIVYNPKKKNNYGEHRGYRIQANGFANQLLPKDIGFESTIPWSRYQMVVTKHKDAEESSGSVHTTLDAGQPVVNFQSFIDDNENIVDEDLVFWLTLGTHHIPKAEDIPNTATSSSILSIQLTPFNYFNEDPSINSRDSVYITPKTEFEPKQGLNIENNVDHKTESCLPKMFSFDELKKDGTSIFFPYS